MSTITLENPIAVTLTSHNEYGVLDTIDGMIVSVGSGKNPMFMIDVAPFEIIIAKLAYDEVYPNDRRVIHILGKTTDRFKYDGVLVSMDPEEIGKLTELFDGK